MRLASEQLLMAIACMLILFVVIRVSYRIQIRFIRDAARFIADNAWFTIDYRSGNFYAYRASFNDKDYIRITMKSGDQHDVIKLCINGTSSDGSIVETESLIKRLFLSSIVAKRTFLRNKIASAINTAISASFYEDVMLYTARIINTRLKRWVLTADCGDMFRVNNMEYNDSGIRLVHKSSSINSHVISVESSHGSDFIVVKVEGTDVSVLQDLERMVSIWEYENAISMFK